jgi:hypothetical protein
MDTVELLRLNRERNSGLPFFKVDRFPISLGCFTYRMYTSPAFFCNPILFAAERKGDGDLADLGFHKNLAEELKQSLAATSVSFPTM